MKSVSELTDFYYKTLYPKLQKLEEERIKIRFRLILAIVAIALITLFVIIALARKNIFDVNFFVVFGMVSFGIFTALMKYLSKDYRKRFKNEIFKPLIHAIDPKLKYLEENHVSQMNFQASTLFATPDRLSGNDHISGVIDGVSIEFSDIHAEKKNKDSKNNSSWSTIFQGLYIITDFPKSFQGKTLVLPDKAQKTFGNLIGGWLQSKNFTQEQLIKMDDIAFEREFVVYATDQIEARYILSHSLMQKIVILKQKAKHDVYLSFINNHLYIAIDFNKDLFEPTFFSSLLDYKVAMEYIQVLSMTVGLVEELKLNQKLWSKH